MKRFRDALVGGTERTWAHLLRDLSWLADGAKLFACKDEFYFDGRNLPQGLGVNGGVILHGHTYGIHT